MSFETQQSQISDTNPNICSKMPETIHKLSLFGESSRIPILNFLEIQEETDHMNLYTGCKTSRAKKTFKSDVQKKKNHQTSLKEPHIESKVYLSNEKNLEQEKERKIKKYYNHNFPIEYRIHYRSKEANAKLHRGF